MLLQIKTAISNGISVLRPYPPFLLVRMCKQFLLDAYHHHPFPQRISHATLCIYTDPRALLHLIESVADLYSDEREDCEDEAGQTQQDQQCHLDVTLNVNSIYKLFRNHCVCSPRNIPTTDLFTFALSRISIMSQGPYVKARHGSEVHR